MYEGRERKSLKRRIEKFVQLGEKKYGKGTYDYSLAKKEYSRLFLTFARKKVLKVFSSKDQILMISMIYLK